MKNREKFAKEILDIVCKGSNVALDRSTGSLQMCKGFLCNKCYFKPANYPNSTAICIENFAHWANSEYKEKTEFSEADKALVKGLDKLNWFARDKSGDVWGFVDRPLKSRDYWNTSGEILRIRKFTTATFEPLSWEDDKPTHRDEILGK